jgi:hypothetical protein
MKTNLGCDLLEDWQLDCVIILQPILEKPSEDVKWDEMSQNRVHYEVLVFAILKLSDEVRWLITWAGIKAHRNTRITFLNLN